MSFAIADRICESTTTNGTGDITLAGHLTGFQSFGAIGDGNTCPYTIYAVDGLGRPTGEWECGVGTYSASGTTLARTVVLSSSNGGSAVDFGAGTKYVECGLLASHAVLADNTVTLTNKTLTAPVIATISNTGLLTLPTATDTLVGRATTDTLTNKTINASSNTVSNLATSMFAANVIDTDGTLAANSDTRLATQKAVKTYADQLIAANDAMVFKGVTDCSGNPNYPAANRGDTYRVSVAGKIGGGSGTNVEIGDLFMCLTDSTASGTQAGVGANWTVVQTNLDGAVIGPASVTNGHVATFNGTTGKIIQSGGKGLPSGAIVGTSDSQTLTNKTLTAPVIADIDGVLTIEGPASGATDNGAAMAISAASGGASSGNGGDVTIAAGGAASGNGGSVAINAGSTSGGGDVGAVNIGTLVGSVNIGGGGGGISLTVGSDATGDIWYRHSDGTMTRLGVGSDGDVLTLASGVPSWAAPGGGGSQTPWTSDINADGFNLLNVLSVSGENAPGATDNGEGVSLVAGNGGATSGNGGNANVTGGAASGGGNAGRVFITGGPANGTGIGGEVAITGGEAAGGVLGGGGVNIQGGTGNGGAGGGFVFINGGPGSSPGGVWIAGARGGVGFFDANPAPQAAFQASPTAETIRDVLIAFGLMAAS